MQAIPITTQLAEFSKAILGYLIILPLSAILSYLMIGRHQVFILEAVKYRVEHAIGPLQFTVGYATNFFDYGVTVVVTLAQYRQHAQITPGKERPVAKTWRRWRESSFSTRTGLILRHFP